MFPRPDINTCNHIPQKKKCNHTMKSQTRCPLAPMVGTHKKEPMDVMQHNS
uniref:Uncharacterized protein n=1 Tax=Setaria italica TaxID=4555 RepID=K3ZZ19_SETIT